MAASGVKSLLPSGVKRLLWAFYPIRYVLSLLAKRSVITALKFIAMILRNLMGCAEPYSI